MSALDDMDAMEKAVEESGHLTEQQMRDADVPWPETVEELAEYVTSLVDRPHDYGTCVYAMSMAALAAMYHVAKKLGVTGFQASCADMDILRRSRRLDDGFRIVNYSNLLYPQYWNAEHFPTAVDLMRDPDVAKRIREKAGELLESGRGVGAVRDHWHRLRESSPELTQRLAR